MDCFEFSLWGVLDGTVRYSSLSRCLVSSERLAPPKTCYFGRFCHTTLLNFLSLVMEHFAVFLLYVEHILFATRTWVWNIFILMLLLLFLTRGTKCFSMKHAEKIVPGTDARENCSIRENRCIWGHLFFSTTSVIFFNERTVFFSLTIN